MKPKRESAGYTPELKTICGPLVITMAGVRYQDMGMRCHLNHDRSDTRTVVPSGAG